MVEAVGDSPQLRPFRAGDADAMAALDTRVNPSPWSAQAIDDSLQQAHARAIVAVQADGAMSGLVLFSTLGEESEILNLAVDRDRQRRGLGRQLLLAALADATGKGARRCFLEVRVSNGSAQALYRGCGFVETGRRKDYYRCAQGREDALLYCLELA